MTNHICHCDICTANRALRAIIDNLPWPPEYQAQLAALEAAHDSIVEKSANDEMEYAWQINRIADALDVVAVPDLIIAKIKELQAQAAVINGGPG